MKIYTENRERLWGVVRLTNLGELFTGDLQTMLGCRLTFDEALSDPALGIMARQRLKMLSREIFEQLDLVPLLIHSPDDKGGI